MDIEEPFDIVKGCIAQKVKVGLKSGKEVRGILHVNCACDSVRPLISI